MLSKDLGIDLGTIHTKIAEDGNVILSEPTVVAIAVEEQKIVEPVENVNWEIVPKDFINKAKERDYNLMFR